MTSVADAIVEGVRRAVVDRGWTTYDGIVPKEPELQYGVVFPSNGQLSRLAYNGAPADGVWRWYVTSVAPTRQAASWHATTVRDFLLSTRLVADGWLCSLARHEHAENPTRDEAVTPRPTVIAVNEYSLLATRI